MATTSADQLFAIAILIDELKHDEVAHRVSSMQHLGHIASALGPDRTQNELLPYLLDQCLDDEDEVLLAMADQLGSPAFHKQAQFKPGQAHVLLPVLEALANVEEPTVRERAVRALLTVQRDLMPGQDGAEVQQHFVPLLRDLAKRDWFTSRITCAALLPSVYSRLSASSSSSKQELLRMFVELGKDDTPMVRKALAQSMPDMVNNCAEEENALNELCQLFSALAQDEHDSVRLLVCPIGIALCQKLKGSNSSNAASVAKQCAVLAQDKGWRVRWSVAQVFHDLLASASTTTSSTGDLVQHYVELLKDAEPEVRTAATGNFTKTAKALSPASVVESTLLPLLPELCQDASEHVREALALVIFGLAPVLGKAKTLQLLLPSFLVLLRDGSAQVRLGMVSQLAALESTVSLDELSQALLPAVVELAQDRNWRVRAQCIAHLPVLAKQMQVDYFEANLLDISLQFLSDHVFSVREAGAGLVQQLCSVFGQEWTLRRIVPKVQQLKQTNNYLYRLTAVRSMETLMGAMESGSDVGERVLLPFILSLASDPVPNVRFGVGKALRRLKLANAAGVKTSQQVNDCLQNMCKDKDKDVVFFAKRALEVV